MSKIAYVFPGQGSQYVGMGKELCSKSDIANDVFNEANQILDYNLKELCFFGPEEKLRLTEFAQPAILTTSVAIYYTLKREYNIMPDFMAGHSLGEITSLVCSGSISFSDGLKLVQKRGKIMGESTQGIDFAMYAINDVDVKLIEEKMVQSSNTCISNYNSPKQTVICGEKKEVNELVRFFEKKGAKCIQLNVSAPFHSKYMKEAANKFLINLENISFNKPSCMILSNYTGKLYSEDIVELLYSQIFMPVQWNNCIKYLIRANVKFIIEIGPKQVLTNMINGSQMSIKARACENYNQIIDVINKMQNSLKEEKSEFKENTLNILAKCLSISVCTPNKNFDNDEYQKGVVEPYSTINQMYEECNTCEKLINKIDIVRVLKMLKCILSTKKVDDSEIGFRIKQLIETTEICNIITVEEINNIMQKE